MTKKNSLSLNIAARWRGHLILLTLVCVSASAVGEDVSLQPLAPGMRVRIQAPDILPGKVVGTIKQASADSLTIAVPGRPELVSVLREKIARLDVSAGPRSRGVDAVIGAGIGAGIGAIAGAAASGGSKGHLVSAGEVTAFCALLGTGLGAVIGAAIPPGEHWNEIRAASPGYRVSFAPQLNRGLDLAVAWSF